VNPTGTTQVLYEIELERRAQDRKFPEQGDMPDGTSPESREVADAARAYADHSAEHGHLTWRDILNEEVMEALTADSVDELRLELIQVAAVAVKWIEAIDKRAP